ncbi:MAG TPA: Uma2 family endonuclease, partial [Thermoanaerobaculia bacterium]
MDKSRTAYSLKAPGAAGSDAAIRLPGREFPGIDSRLVVPEVTRDEIIGGRRVVASPAQLPHARQHGELTYVLRAHAAPGYVTSVDLLTRHAVKADFASDSCLLRDGIDPATGTRYLEELAVEIVSEQTERDVTEKAVQMHRRGVRRIFALMLKKRQV